MQNKDFLGNTAHFKRQLIKDFLYFFLVVSFHTHCLCFIKESLYSF